MTFASSWSRPQNPWRSLVLGLWLFSFVFSFAASDCFHSANCPEEALLRWAAHAGHASVHGGPGHAVQADVDCAACAVQSVALAMVAACVWVLPALGFVLVWAQVVRVRPLFAFALPIARGPPSSV